MSRFPILLILISSVIPKAVKCQVDSLNFYYTESINSYKAGDYENFLLFSQKFNDIHPSHPTMTYNLASAYTLNGHFKHAEKYLLSALFINAKIPYQTDPDFQLLQKKAILKNLQEHQHLYSGKINSGTSLQLNFPGILHGETIEFVDDLLIIGTVRAPSLFVYSLKNETLNSLFPYNSMNSPFAFTSVFYDSENKYVWTTSVAMPEVVNFTESNKNKGGIMAIDLSGRIINQYEYNNHQLQDIIKAGDKLLVSDGLTGNIYELKENGELQVFCKISSAFNLQSMAYDSERNKLYVADYIRGIYVIDMKKGEHSLLSAPEHHLVLKGIDGLEYFDGSLFAIHNGVKPNRVVQYELGRSKIKSYRILEQNVQDTGEPTSGAIGNGKLYYIANSPWDAYEKQEWIPERAQPLQIRYLKLK